MKNEEFCKSIGINSFSDSNIIFFDFLRFVSNEIRHKNYSWLYDFLTFEFFTIYIDYIDIQLLIANVVFILFETLQGMRLHVICNHVAFLWMSWRDKPVLASNQYIAGLLCRTLLTPKMVIWPSDK